MSESKEPAVKESPRCQVGQLQGDEFAMRRFVHRAPIGIRLQQLLEQEYWSHVSQDMTPYSEVSVRAEDGTFYAKLLVLDCGRSWARMQVLGHWPLTTADVAQSQSQAPKAVDFKIEYKGPNRKYVVLRLSDQAAIHEGEARKEGAEIWLKEYIAGKAHVTPVPQTVA